MWIFTPQGFISAVADRNNPEKIVVRARNPDHLRTMFPDEVISETNQGDYPARVFIDRGRFAGWLYVQAYDLDYTNFKDAIPEDAPAYHDACVGVWAQMHDIEPERQR